MSEPQEPAAKQHADGPAQAQLSALRRVFEVALVLALILYFGAAALFVGLRYVLLPRIDSFRPQLEALVSRQIHTSFTIGKLEAHWSGLEPVLDLTDLRILGHDGRAALSVPHASAVFSWTSLAHLTPILSSLTVDTPDMLVERRADGSLYIGGIAVPNATSGDPTFSTWLLKQRAIVLRNGTLRWRDAQHGAPPDLVLSGIRVAVLNHALLHRVALQAPANGTLLDGPLDFRARFLHNPFGVVGKPSNWKGTAYLSTGAVDLPTLTRYATIPLENLGGRISNQVWIHFSGGHLRSARGSMNGEAVTLRASDQPRLDIPYARVDWQLAIDPHLDYRLRLSNLHAELAQPPLDDGTPILRALVFDTLNARYRLPSVHQGLLLSVAGDRVDLGVLGEFVRGLPLPANFRSELSRYAPHGLIEHYQLEAERAKPANAAQVDEERRIGSAPVIHYRVVGDLRGLSFAAQPPAPGLNAYGHPHVGIPGVENLWGHVDADERHGQLTLDTVGAAVTVPGLFEEPRLALDRLSGQAQWSVSPARGNDQHPHVDLQMPELFVANPDAAIHTTLHYVNTGTGQGTLDLKSTFDRAAVARIPRYLPTSLADHLRHYLAHALQAGEIQPGATIVARGPLEPFPYDREPNAGIFQIHAPFTDGQFEPTPEPVQTLSDGTPNVWPALSGINGVFQISENLLRFEIGTAHYKRFVFDPVVGQITDLGHPASAPLVISGKGHGPLPDFIDYVEHSPLGARAGHFGERLHTDGPADFALTLTFPQHAPHGETGVDGSLALGGDTLAMDGMPPLSAVSGTLHFTRQSAQTNRLTGRLLGGDWRARGSYTENGRYAFDIDGRVATAGAGDLDLRGPAAALLARMTGSAPYHLSLRGSARSGLPEISAQSDLTGLALDFPAPLAKPAGTPMPFNLSLLPVHGRAASDDTLDSATLRLGPLTAAYQIEAPRDAPAHALRGIITTDSPDSAPLLPEQGVQAKLAVPALDLDAWQRFLRAIMNNPGGTSGTPASRTRLDTASLMPQHVSLAVDALTLAERRWDQVRLDAERSGTRWQGKLTAKQAAGTLSWNPAASGSVLRARLSRLDVPRATNHATPAEHLGAPSPDASGTPRALPATPLAGNAQHTLPAVDLVADQFSVAGHALGRLEIQARNLVEAGGPVWRLDRLTLANPAARFSATGQSSAAAGNASTDRKTALDFKLDVDDAGALLERAGLPRTLAAGHGTLAGRVDWRGDPTAPDYASLGGKLSLDLHDGQILRLEAGASNLLSVLSLQSLARFLTLDFRDLTSTSVPFQQISGTAQIDSGVMRLSDFAMNTTPIKVGLSGSVDLNHETQDLRAHVTPKIGAGTAALATAVINPLLGLGVLAADVALSQTLSHALSFDYAITGSWAHPRIERVGNDQSKINHNTSHTAAYP